MNPGHVVVDSLARHEKGVILQPLLVVLGKGFEGATIGLGSVLEKSVSGFVKESLLEFDDAVVRHPLVWKVRHMGQVLRRQKPLLTKRIQIDEQRVSGERRKTLIGGIAVSGGTQRQYLPDFLSGSRQKVDELAGRISEVADAMATGQR